MDYLDKAASKAFSGQRSATHTAAFRPKLFERNSDLSFRWGKEATRVLWAQKSAHSMLWEHSQHKHFSIRAARAS